MPCDVCSQIPGKIIPCHWLCVALDRVVAGEPEESVLTDYGWMKEPPGWRDGDTSPPAASDVD